MPVFTYGTGKLDTVDYTDSGGCRVSIVDDSERRTDTYEVEPDPERNGSLRMDLLDRLAAMRGRRVWMKYRVTKVWPERGKPLDRRLLVDVDEIGDIVNTRSRYWEWSTLPIIGVLSIALAVVLMAFEFASSPNAAASQRQTRSTWVVANADIDGNTEIIKLPVGGGSTMNLSTNAASDYDPAISPDGTRIAFVSNRESGVENVWVMASDGSSASNLTFNPLIPSSSSSSPAWSPDGSKIAFSSNRYGPSDIWTMNSDGSDQRVVAWDSATDDQPSYNDDATRIAYQSEGRIVSIRPDGTDREYVTDPQAVGAQSDANPVYSPDGHELAFWRASYPGGSHLMVARANGESVRELSTGAGVARQPAWDPDGRSIIFASDRDAAEPGSGASTDLYSLNMRSGDVTRLTTHALSDGNPSAQFMMAPTGVEPTVSSFYFAEGTVRPGFAQYFTIQNPGSRSANVALEFQAADDSDNVVDLPTLITTVGARSRTTVNMADYARLNGVRQPINLSTRITSDEQILAERPLYFSVDPALGARVTGGTTVVGISELATTWQFAEGTFRPGFVQYFTMQNPNDDEARVTLDFQAADDAGRQVAVAPVDVTIRAHGRRTVNVTRVLEAAGHRTALNISTLVTSSEPIAVERPMYFAGEVGTGSRVLGGSDAFGQRMP